MVFSYLIHSSQMLWFMHTDALPGDNELGDSLSEMMQLASMHLEGLKLLCEQKLWEDVPVDTFAATIACAEM